MATDPIQSFSAQLPSWIPASKYLILYILAIFEGPIIMTLSGFLLRMGSVEFLPLYAVLMAGDLTADVGWYAVGAWGGRKFIKKFGWLFHIKESAADRLTEMFRKHDNKILLISKLTMGFGFAIVTLMAAGMAKVPVKKYLALNTLGQFVWTALLLSLGYSFGNLYLLFGEVTRIFSLVLFVAILAAALYGASRYLQKRIAKNQI